MPNALHAIVGEPHSKRRRGVLGGAAVLLAFFVGMQVQTIATAGGNVLFVVGGLTIGLLASAELVNRATENHRGDGYDDLEHIVIASDDAYDYADSLDDGKTVVEDKRNAECYLAERRGDA